MSASTIARLRMDRLGDVLGAKADEMIARQKLARSIAEARRAGCNDAEISAAIAMIERAAKI